MRNRAASCLKETDLKKKFYCREVNLRTEVGCLLGCCPVLSASVSKAIALMMEAASTSETSVDFTRLHGATTQKTSIFTLATVRTSN
jgi:hypothetical protein